MVMNQKRLCQLISSIKFINFLLVFVFGMKILVSNVCYIPFTVIVSIDWEFAVSLLVQRIDPYTQYTHFR